jgi:alpha-amylase/alpha-mannosidase (GH57 family)
MSTSKPLHIAFVWHMHQPYYRLGRDRPFEMPWARMHALKDYLDMVLILGQFPDLHQTFNLVPSLVEQLEDYAAGDFSDVYWDHTLKPAADLTPAERVFVVERMCEHTGHPRARSHARYFELAQKREAHASQGWEACACAFTVPELRDLQVWFNLAWFEPQTLDQEPLADLVARGRDFREDHKLALAQVQADILARTLPAYREAAGRGQIELSTSPYFHPILPLLANTDSARVAIPGVLLPTSRFAHPEDAVAQVQMAVNKHRMVFGETPRGMWCSEQAVGEDVIPMLIEAGITWTISDEMVLARSLSGTVASAARGGAEASASSDLTAHTLYRPYVLEREGGRVAIVFRDHTLSDLIGFVYQSWDSRDAAADFISRLHDIRTRLTADVAHGGDTGSADEAPLVTIALDGENAWEYYSRDGRDFLEALYEKLSNDPLLQCVTVSEHLAASPPTRSLPWLHTGSWIGGDLSTWIGDRAHGLAWDALHRARDHVARCAAPATSPAHSAAAVQEAWHHIRIVEGSDWFWWFGDRHHTELDHVWDAGFRRHLREAYQVLGATPPPDLFLPILEGAPIPASTAPTGSLCPVIDGVMGPGADGIADEWAAAGILAADTPSTMQHAEGTKIREVRFGWRGNDLCLLVVPSAPSLLPGLEVEVCLTRPGMAGELLFTLFLEDGGRVRISCRTDSCLHVVESALAAWHEVLEVMLPLGLAEVTPGDIVLILRTGRDGMIEHTFQATSPAPAGEAQP